MGYLDLIMTSYVVKRHGLSLTGLFAFGLILMLVLGGKTGQAQNDFLGAPIPMAKPDHLASANISINQPSESTGTPVPRNKPRDEKEGGSFILASLTNFASMKKPDAVDQKSDQTSSQKRGIFTSRDILKDRDVTLYQEVFALQKTGQFKEADKNLKRVKNDILKGHILANRYLATNYTSSYKELVRWLKQYDDHPQAGAVYKLMLSKKPQGVNAGVSKPKVKSLLTGNLGTATAKEKRYQSAKNRNGAQQASVQKLSYQIHRHVKKYEPTKALHLLGDSDAVQHIDDVEYDRMRASIASGYLYASKPDEAERLAKASWKRSGQYAPMAGWVYGLSLWQKQQYKQAAHAFESAAASPYSSGWMVSASAFWASRAHMRSGNEVLVTKWLKLASSYPRTFYGVIATQAMGKRLSYNWDVPSFDKEARTLIQSTPSGKRAVALLEIGHVDRAEKELLRFDAALTPDKQRALIALSAKYDLPALQMRLGSLYSKQGALYDAALYPWAPWEPSGGYRVDKSLIHAIVRQESRFDPSAANPSGATGLMQLMPTTASYIAGHDRFKTPEGRKQLKQPHVNLALGQDYVAHLLKHRAVKGDLLSLAIAYNAGPGNLSRWKSERKHIKDPLLFIETIPFAETRAFVERVLSNYWIYESRAGKRSPSLEAVANGKWAHYAGEIRPSAIDLASAY